MATATPQQFAQTQPSVTSAVTLFTNGASQRTIVRQMSIVNTHATSPALISIFHDDDGSTYGPATEIFRETLAPGASRILENQQIGMDGSTDNIGVQTDVINAVTFTAWGVVVA